MLWQSPDVKFAQQTSRRPGMGLKLQSECVLVPVGIAELAVYVVESRRLSRVIAIAA